MKAEDLKNLHRFMEQVLAEIPDFPADSWDFFTECDKLHAYLEVRLGVIQVTGSKFDGKPERVQVAKHAQWLNGQSLGNRYYQVRDLAVAENSTSLFEVA